MLEYRTWPIDFGDVSEMKGPGDPKTTTALRPGN